MEKAYWLRRNSASLRAARDAAGPEARLAHYELAGRYSVKAALADPHASDLGEACHPNDHSEDTHV